MSSLSEGSKKWVTKLSSAGLVYLHFGHRVLSTIAGIYMYVHICVCVCVCVYICMYAVKGSGYYFGIVDICGVRF